MLKKKPIIRMLLVLYFVATMVGSRPAGAQLASPGWIVTCAYSHSLNDDPIVSPGQPGVSHLHDFSGATTTDAFSTPEPLIAGGTSCEVAADTSAYWVPAVYEDGVRILPTATEANSLFYYRRKGAPEGTVVQPFPLGLKIIIGNAHATSPAENPQLGTDIVFKCGPGSGTDLPAPPSECDTGILVMSLRFPNCWDGVNLDSADHRSHMEYPVGDSCPASHPVVLPRLESFFRYDVGPGPIGTITLDSGPYYTAHQDFFNAWEPEGLQELITTCINAMVDCGTNPSLIPPTASPTPDPALVPLSFTPVGDASIQASNPSSNFGLDPSLEVDGRPEKHFLLKYVVTGVGTSQVESATLRLYNTNSSKFGGYFHHAADDSWQEGTVTWSNAPDPDLAAFASLGPVSAGNFYDVDLGTLIQGDGTYTIRVLPGSDDGADYSSREGFQPPELVLQLSGPQGPSPSPTHTPTATFTDTATSTVDASATLSSTSTASPTTSTTLTPTAIFTDTAAPSPTLTATATPTPFDTPTTSPSPSAAPTSSPTPTDTDTPTPTDTASPTASATLTAMPTFTPTVAPSATFTITASPTTGPTSATDVIFANGFESGSLSAWSSSTTDAGDLSVSTAAALNGSFGLRALVDDNIAIYLTDDTPAGETRYRARFYFDPNSITMASGNSHYLFYGYSGNSTLVLRVELRFSGGSYQVRTAYRNDGSGWTSSSWVTITDAPHSLELDWQASSAAGASNGRLSFWIDGVQRANLTGMDNDTRRIDRIRLGAVAGIDTGTRGTYYFDLFESRRQTYIGP